jgi:hypothetical protein
MELIVVGLFVICILGVAVILLESKECYMCGKRLPESGYRYRRFTVNRAVCCADCERDYIRMQCEE